MTARFARWLLVGTGALAAPPPDVKVVEQIVAKINNEIITQGELDRSRRQLEAELKRQGLSSDRLE